MLIAGAAGMLSQVPIPFCNSEQFYGFGLADLNSGNLKATDFVVFLFISMLQEYLFIFAYTFYILLDLGYHLCS